MEVVLVHDYLNQRGGAERVVSVLHELYPGAPIYTLFVEDSNLWPALRGAKILPSWLQHSSFVRRHFKLWFWLYPFAVRTLRIPECDVVITSSSAYAKGIRLPKGINRKPLHVCYCHSPMRFAWNFDEYIANETSNKLLVAAARRIVPLLKWWDRATSKNVDVFIANSTAVKKRIHAAYGRNSHVIFPPVEARQVEPSPLHPALALFGEDYYLIVSRLVSYKGIDLAVEACTRTGANLLVIGTGPDGRRLKSLAGPTVRFLGWQSDEAVSEFMNHCKALIFPGEEDFGITLVEANLAGRPVVAYRGGGALDTIRPGTNGVFFDEFSVEALQQAMERVAAIQWNSEEIRKWAARFSRARFESEFVSYIEEVVSARRSLAPSTPRIVSEGGTPQ